MSDEIMTKEEAELMMMEWAEAMELDTESTVFKNLVEELSFVVRKGKLTFNEETEIFTYMLLKPIDTVSIVEIKECDFKSKVSLERFKENEGIKASMKMMTNYTNLTYPQVEQLKDRDINKMNAVILGFLSHTPQSRN